MAGRVHVIVHVSRSALLPGGRFIRSTLMDTTPGAVAVIEPVSDPPCGIIKVTGEGTGAGGPLAVKVTVWPLPLVEECQSDLKLIIVPGVTPLNTAISLGVFLTTLAEIVVPAVVQTPLKVAAAAGPVINTALRPVTKKNVIALTGLEQAMHTPCRNMARGKCKSIRKIMATKPEFNNVCCPEPVKENFAW